jgi:hypothetical protein
MILRTVLAIAMLQSADAPVLYDIHPIQEGEPSPVTGRVMSAETYVLIAQRVKRAEEEKALMSAPSDGRLVAVVAILCVLSAVGGVYLGVRLQAALAPP